MMVYLDTNVLIYATIEQDIDKKGRSLNIIEHLAKNKELILSPPCDSRVYFYVK